MSDNTTNTNNIINMTNTFRAYILNSSFDFNNNNIYQINLFNQINQINKKDSNIQYRKYIVKKRSYLNIIQKNIIYSDNKDNKDNKDNIITTYCENFKIITINKNKIILEYNQEILDNNEFPPLFKYDIDEEYEEKEYITTYGKIIENKYESYLEIDPKYNNEKYYNLIFV